MLFPGLLNENFIACVGSKVEGLEVSTRVIPDPPLGQSLVLVTGKGRGTYYSASSMTELLSMMVEYIFPLKVSILFRREMVPFEEMLKEEKVALVGSGFPSSPQ